MLGICAIETNVSVSILERYRYNQAIFPGGGSHEGYAFVI
jgi:hypothetical protein